MPPTVPINHYFSPRNQQNRTKVLFHYSMLMYPSQNACFEHSNFFKVKVPNSTGTQLSAPAAFEQKGPSHRARREADGTRTPEIQLRAF